MYVHVHACKCAQALSTSKCKFLASKIDQGVGRLKINGRRQNLHLYVHVHVHVRVYYIENGFIGKLQRATLYAYTISCALHVDMSWFGFMKSNSIDFPNAILLDLWKNNRDFRISLLFGHRLLIL